MADPLRRYVIPSHAARAMRRRGIDQAHLRQILASPEQRFPVREGRDVLQGRVDFGGKLYLVRAFADVDRDPAEIVTVYKTSRIGRYWRTSK